MKNLYLILFLLLFSSGLRAQVSKTVPANALPPPLPSREVSGIVKDSTDKAVGGATVTLMSKKDTLKAVTDNEGIFLFADVKLATFVIEVKSIGYATFLKRYLNNDLAKKIVLLPIELSEQPNMLNTVTINGTPSIIYKTDTVEFRASDYKVRDYATVDELLKKMEGVEVSSDGNLTYQGQQVTKARVNGKDFAGGDVKQAIQNLPADIVEKVQMVNDYGDQAGRTGIKSGNPTTVLNLTTKRERSVGNFLRLTASDGTDNRYDEKVFALRINANQQINFTGNITNTLNGVAERPANGTSVTGGGVSGGTTTSGNPTFSYRDQWGKAIQINTFYSYGFTDVNSIVNSTGQMLSSSGTTSFIRNSTGTNNNRTHNFSFELEFTPDSSNFLRITPSFSYTGLTSSNNQQYTQTGFQNQYSSGITNGKSTLPTYGAIILYQYIFKKDHRRNMSVQFNLNHANHQNNTETNTEIQYKDINQNLVKDSLVHRSIDRGNMTKNYRSSFTYAEPLSQLSQLEFNAQINYRGYTNKAITNNLSRTRIPSVIDSLSNNYSYSFTESRVSVNYRLNQKKYNLSLGMTAIPTHLAGTNISKGFSTSRNNFYFVPLFRFQYQFSNTQQLSVNYNGMATEPNFTEIQPIPDYSDPQNPVFGNSNLKPSFTHSISMGYNNYLANSKLNFSTNIQTSIYQDRIVTNVIQVSQPELHSFLNEVHYVNLNGAYYVQLNHSITKQLNDRKYTLSLNGTIAYNHDAGMSNSIMNYLTTWRISERFGPRINPSTFIEINPSVSYNITRTFNSIGGINRFVAANTDIKIAALNLDGRFYLFRGENFILSYNISKNYISGIASNITKNPFVANFYIEKRFLKRKNATMRLSVFDLLNQNNFISHVVTTNGYTDTRTNALSRYFSFSVMLNLQKWSAIGKRNGKVMQRKGDGSFIY